MNDILLNSTNDLLIVDGDFAVGDSLNQQVGLLLLVNKGEVKQHPLTGVGINDLLLAESMTEIYNEVRMQLKDDGLKLRKIEQVNGKIYIAAENG
jgi:hypothetical protein